MIVSIGSSKSKQTWESKKGRKNLDHLKWARNPDKQLMNSPKDLANKLS